MMAMWGNFFPNFEVIQQDDESIIVTILSDTNFIHSVSKSRVRVEKKNDDADALDDEKSMMMVMWRILFWSTL